jgi:predicted small lipoprotein YifL
VLQLVAEGKANKQVAAELGISIKTVEKHRDHLMRKLDIHDTAGLTRYAIAAGIIEKQRPGDDGAPWGVFPSFHRGFPKNACRRMCKRRGQEPVGFYPMEGDASDALDSSASNKEDNMKKNTWMAMIALVGVVGLSGCGQKTATEPGAAEKAGAAVDRAAENTADKTRAAAEKAKEAGDKAVEKTGEALEKAGENMQE